ncbi:Hypothetical predicted protein [Octopus vulgaris]|uniref:Uncharacterized protein n=2 Tax=Octopus TaxID=6643 RepID=A0AA36AS47_OCTVU|nr:tumor protein p53-inducible nuclear protein 1 [Octopus sinensis]CAI9721291.1 Hypothetical predicted protein [Octopus vulgaris]
MLKGVADFFFGTGSADSEQQCEELNIKTHVTEEDWIFVETQTQDAVDESLPSVTLETADNTAATTEDIHLDTASSKQDCSNNSKCDELEDITVVHPHLDLVPITKTCTRDTALPAEHSLVRHSDYICIFSVCPSESWIVDPPACFTASQRGSEESSVLQTTMENLLIEHPSMSVYDSYSRSINSDGDDDDGDDEDDDNDEEEGRVVADNDNVEHITAVNLHPVSSFRNISLPLTRSQPVHNNQTGRCHQNLTNAQPLLTKLKTYRLMLQKQSYEQSHHYNKKYLNRNNKLVEYSHLGKRQRHRARYQCPSGRMNGRIGQRRAF